MIYTYSYGCNAPLSGLEDAHLENTLCAHLWNRLIEIDREIDQSIFDGALRDLPELQAIIAQKERLYAALDKMKAEAAPNEKFWKTDPWTEVIKDLRALKTEQWALVKKWKKENKDFCTEKKKERNDLIKEARNNSGLWWPNYNAVIQRYEASRQTCLQKGRRIKQKNPDRQDSGCLTIQIQRTRTGLGAAPAEIRGQYAAFKIDPAPLSKQLYRAEFAVRPEEKVIIPMFFHRPFPPNCRIKQIQFSWYKKGDTTKYKLGFSINDPLEIAAIPYIRSGKLSLHWTENADGSLLVCKIADKTYNLPAKWNRRYNLVEKMHSELDQEANDFYAEWKDKLPEPVQEYCTVDRDHHLYRDYRGLHACMLTHQGKIDAEAMAWRTRHKRKLQSKDGLRDRLIASRKELYISYCREIVREFTDLTLDARDLSNLAEENKGGRMNSVRFRVAPHVFRSEIIHQARKAGSTVRLEGASAPVVSPTDREKISAWEKKKTFKANRSQTEEAVDFSQNLTETV